MYCTKPNLIIKYNWNHNYIPVDINHKQTNTYLKFTEIQINIEHKVKYFLQKISN